MLLSITLVLFIQLIASTAAYRLNSPYQPVYSRFVPRSNVYGINQYATNTLPPIATATSTSTSTNATNTTVVQQQEVIAQLILDSGCSAYTNNTANYTTALINGLVQFTGANITQFNITGISCTSALLSSNTSSSSSLNSMLHINSRSYHIMNNNGNDGMTINMSIRPLLDNTGNIVDNSLLPAAIIQSIQLQQQTPGSALLSSSILGSIQPVSYSIKNYAVSIPSTSTTTTSPDTSTPQSTATSAPSVIGTPDESTAPMSTSPSPTTVSSSGDSVNTHQPGVNSIQNNINRLSSKTIIGIVIGSVVCSIIIIISVYIYIRRRRRQPQQHEWFDQTIVHDSDDVVITPLHNTIYEYIKESNISFTTDKTNSTPKTNESFGIVPLPNKI